MHAGQRDAGSLQQHVASAALHPPGRMCAQFGGARGGQPRCVAELHSTTRASVLAAVANASANVVAP